MPSNPLTFSTLGCGEWSRETVIERAALRRRVSDAGLITLAVTAYSRFTSPEANERAAQLEHLKQHLDLAADLGAQYVRTFIGQLAEGRTRAEALPAIHDCLRAGADYAAPLGVIVAAESHDDWVRSATVADIMQAVPHPALRALWDFGNAFAAGEDPDEGLRQLGPYLGYVHVKDGRLHAGQWQLTPLGEGQVPLGHVIAGLRAAGYTGALTVEWERAWHPELAPAETALPAALAALKRLLAEASQEQTTP